ncbi:MAG: transketolase [Christensenella sp.]|nr:transketolase [Christensenella sp.]
MNHDKQIEKMQQLSAEIRKETVRAIGAAGFGHIGGSVSIADVLAVLYGGLMKIDPKDPKWENRDWLVMSKGHCGPGLYAALALAGYFPMDWLKTVNKPGTSLPSHADGQKTPGVDMSTGSLGQGMSSAVGIALGNRIQGRESYTYCILGDGELNEGEVWEGCEAAAHQNLDHLIVFVDWNKKQLDGKLEDICKPLSIEAKFTAFGFDVQTVCGYDVAAIWQAAETAKTVSGKPHVILLDTIKGLGIKFAEEEAFNHYMTFDSAAAEAACAEIDKRLAEGTYPRGDFRW